MGHEMKVSEMGVPCSMQGADKICIRDISCKSWKEKPLRILHGQGRILLKWI